MKKIFNEPIKIQVISLVLLFLFTILIVYLLDSYILTTTVKYEVRIENSQEKSILGKILKSKLFNMENVYVKIAHAKKKKEVEIYSYQFNKLANDFEKVMKLIEKGGVYEEKIKINTINRSEIIETVKYNKTDTISYVLEIIELNPQIELIKNSKEILFKVVKDKIQSETDFSDKKEAEINYTVKKTLANYHRMQKTINKIHYDTVAEIKAISLEQEQVIRKLKIINLSVIILLIIIITITTLLIFIKLSKLLNENKKIPLK